MKKLNENQRAKCVKICTDWLNHGPNIYSWVTHSFPRWFYVQVSHGAKPEDIDIDEFLQTIPQKMFDYPNPNAKYAETIEKKSKITSTKK